MEAAAETAVVGGEDEEGEGGEGSKVSHTPG